jgi:hypothetical protein
MLKSVLAQGLEVPVQYIFVGRNTSPKAVPMGVMEVEEDM